jgi:hypothetical protein
MPEPAALSPDNTAPRRAASDTARPNLARQVLAQWGGPLQGACGGPSKATVLGILCAVLHEQQQYRPGYAAFMAVDPRRTTALV